MPALGKSGTLRIFDLSESIVCLSRHTKSGEAARWLDVQRVDIVDTRPRRAPPYRDLEPLHCVGVPFGDDLNAPVMLVAHVALNTFALRRDFDEKSEPDALHPALHDVPAPHKHAELYRYKKRAPGFER